VRDVSVDESGRDSDDGPESEPESEPTLEDLRGVDEDVAAELHDAEISPRDLLDRQVSYRDLVEGGVDDETATAVRREFSLLYASTLGDDLSERSDAMEHLRGNERAWIAASDGDWEDVEYDPILEERETVDVWADRERPTPVTAVAGVSEADAGQLAEAGVSSVKQLRWVDASVVAEATDLDVPAVRTRRLAAPNHI
jgi:hypothetical protein